MFGSNAAIEGVPMLRNTVLSIVFIGCCASCARAADHKPLPKDEPAAWNRAGAAQYLDSREQWWLNWPKSQRDHATACISCHTAVPYAMARPALHDARAADPLSPQERVMLGYVTKRVALWDEVEPFYKTDEKAPRRTEESRGTESVLNALVLARYDSVNGSLRDVTRDAFAHMWSLQIIGGDDAGSWDWLNFHNAPWESDESHYYGATLAAIAVGMAPPSYRQSSAVARPMDSLRRYLNRDYEKQPLLNQVVLLWASAKIDGLLSSAQRTALLADIAAHQQADGGWSLANLGTWKRRDNTPLDAASDGYATGLVVYALRQNGVSAATPEVRRGTAWLVKNQDPADGHWRTASLNKERDPASDPAKFMSDAATAYAVMALEPLQQ
jgi:squalene-hopene/tetraprenyl-beta-curcumene cyclase